MSYTLILPTESNPAGIHLNLVNFNIMFQPGDEVNPIWINCEYIGEMPEFTALRNLAQESFTNLIVQYSGEDGSEAPRTVYQTAAPARIVHVNINYKPEVNKFHINYNFGVNI
ncbi:MAG: hypothetical protein E7270_01535 [Lachnospiraceae bacterium]|nr:hypothetical protein [Lachnospiraceae bacterium]